jgi:hypothetical protein
VSVNTRPRSHAAVVARGMGKCCVSGCQEIEVDQKSQTITLASGKVRRGGGCCHIDACVCMAQHSIGHMHRGRGLPVMC